MGFFKGNLLYALSLFSIAVSNVQANNRLGSQHIDVFSARGAVDLDANRIYNSFAGRDQSLVTSSSNVTRRDLPPGSCDSNTPCANGSCCSKSGFCGYSPSFCGSGNCTSNCNAKAECGQYAPAGQQKCPLNVCCSQYGFCGTTSDFCGKGCDTTGGQCGDVNRPSCGGGSSVSKRTIGYYESWSSTRQCQSVQPPDLDLSGFTHMNFAFAFFDPSSFQIAPMDSHSASLYTQFTGLKSKASGLQTWISVGGWSFTDPGPTRTAFSTMASSSSNRATFIQSLISFMNQYGFDGVDLDWEYPAADDRGGVSADTANYVTLLKEMRAAFGSKYGISLTLPTSYWYLQHFDLPGLAPSVDWFNFMSYDLHGVWDAEDKYVGPYIAPHTNVTEIDMGLDLLWRAGIDSSKVVMGQGWYGRSFTLSSSSCSTPNGVCQFSGPANAGPCSNAPGILDLQEIQNIISQNSLTPVWDKTAAVKWITWNSNQWVSYDDDDTFQQKRDFANSRCLGGLMVWAIDQRDQTQSNGLAPAPGVTQSDQQTAQSMTNDQNAQAVCYTSDCGAKCKKGTSQVTQMNGQPNSLSTRDRCPSGKYQTLCCPKGTTLGKCQWRGWRGVGLSCNSGCNPGETELVKNTNNHNKKTDQSCNGGLQSYCCAGFKPPVSEAELEKEAADALGSAAQAFAEQEALDVAAKAFCRIAVPALLAPLELLEDAIPIIGEIADLVEIAATPAIIEGCVKGIEKEGKAEFKIFGKRETLSINTPKEAPTDRPPASSHPPPKTSSGKPTRTSSDDNNAPTPMCGARTVRSKRSLEPTKQPTQHGLVARSLQSLFFKAANPIRSLLASPTPWSSAFEKRDSLSKRAFLNFANSWSYFRSRLRNSVQNFADITTSADGTDIVFDTTARFQDLTNFQQTLAWLSGPLGGCTVLFIASQQGVYLAHFWENPGFNNAGNFNSKVISFLHNGRSDAHVDEDGGPDNSVALAPHAANFKGVAGLTAFIYTPQSQAKGAGSGTAMYKAIAQLQSEVNSIVGITPRLVTYVKPATQDTVDNIIREVAVQYDPAQPGSDGSKREVRAFASALIEADIRW